MKFYSDRTCPTICDRFHHLLGKGDHVKVDYNGREVVGTIKNIQDKYVFISDYDMTNNTIVAHAGSVEFTY